MRVIIAGSRKIGDFAVVEEAVRRSGFRPSVVVSGGARGVDKLGERWSREHLGIEPEVFAADWEREGKAAGPIRNALMAENADALIAVWDGESPGTRDMIKRALSRGLKVYIYDLSAALDREQVP